MHEWVSGGFERLERVRELPGRAVEVLDRLLHHRAPWGDHRRRPEGRARDASSPIEQRVAQERDVFAVGRDRGGQLLIAHRARGR